MNLRLFQTVPDASNCTTLNGGFGSAIMQPCVSLWLPLLFPGVVTVNVTGEVVHEAMIPLLQLVQHIRTYQTFDPLNRPALLLPIDDRDRFALHGAEVGQLGDSDSSCKDGLVGDLALIKQPCELTTSLSPGQDGARHIDQHEVQVVESLCRILIFEDVFLEGRLEELFDIVDHVLAFLQVLRIVNIIFQIREVARD